MNLLSQIGLSLIIIFIVLVILLQVCIHYLLRIDKKLDYLIKK